MSRRRSHDEDDVSEDGATPGSQGSKRRRLNLQDEASDDDLLPESFRRSPRANRHANEKHQPGSLIRISVKNFVTYTKATFNCGPSLNMIIGPNGTGKSTLVCAICLGLGSKPAVLGRSKEIGEYVKNGHREAEIEVELAGKEGKDNPVIQHTIKREGNKSSWRINGRQTTHKEVATLVRSYSIQIDNLCQFLPQDRVVEFAQMTPVGLLESTQKAAAREEMTAWHAQLKQLGQERINMQATNAEDANLLSNLEKRHAQQQGEVARIHERRALQTRLLGLEMAKPIMQYRTSRAEIAEMKQARRDREEELAMLTEQVAPALRSVTNKEAHVDEIKAAVDEASVLVKRFETTLAAKAKAANDKKDDIDSCETEHSTEVQAYKARVPEINRLEQSIKNLKHQHEREPVAFDAPAFNARIREKEVAIQALRQKASDIKGQEQEIKEKVQQKKVEWDKAKADLQELQSAAGQQNAKLKNASGDSLKAYLWLQRNAGQFRDKIYGPPLVECTVKDPRYAGALESIINRGDMVCFTATNRDDWKKFLDVCQNVLKIKDITAKVAPQPMSFWTPPYSQDELEDYGLQDFAINFLDGPEPVLSMLCDSVRLHKTGVSLNDTSDAQFERLKESQVTNWVAGRNTYRVNRRREYGPGAVSTVVSQVKAASFWTNNASGGDTDTQRQINITMKDIERELADLEDQSAPIADQLKGLGVQTRKLAEEKETIANEKGNAQKAYSEWFAIPRRITTLEEKRDAKQQLQDETRDKLEEIAEKKRKLILERAQLAIDSTLALERNMQMVEELMEMEVQLAEAESELEHLNEESQRVRDMLKERQIEVNILKEQLQVRIEAAKKLSKQIEANIAALRENENCEQIELMRDRWLQGVNLDDGEDLDEEAVRTIEDLDAEIVATNGRLELLHEGNPRALQQFEQRAIQIAQTKDKIANFEANLAAISAAIDEIRQKWEPELEHLVERISEAFAHNFERIGCAGQVSVRKDENDFREWAIQIEVKFRENEELAILDSHRQSGGERAVSTIFYLMALQSMARSPFRVVDEINQGMDPRNERMVHERMVDIACSENTSQYFLVTPKLLNGLKYHPRMVVHVIYSGSEMPANEGEAEEGSLDFGRLAELALRMGRVH